MSKTIARYTGARFGIIGALGGLALAYAMYTCMLVVAMDTWSHAAGWIVHVKFALNISIGAVATLCASWYLGQKAGINILIQRKNYVVVGITSGFMSVWIGSLIGSVPGFLAQSLGNNGFNFVTVFDYLGKPVIALTAVGTVPIVVVGLWTGKKIRSRLK